MNSVRDQLDLAILQFITDNKKASKILLKYFDFEAINQETAYVYFDLKSKRYKISIFEQWITGFETEEVSALIEHEISHALLRHLERRQNRDSHRWNIATDLFINETNNNIKKRLQKRFPGAVWLENVKLKEKVFNVSGYTVDELYELLEDNENTQSFDSHLLEEGKEEEENAVLDAMTRELEQLAIGEGGGLSKILLTISQRERENRALKRLLNSLNKTIYKKSNLSSPTFKRKSRRLSQYDFVKGKHKKHNIPYVLVGIDTSGSMQRHEPLIRRFIATLENYNIQYDLTIGDESERLFIPHSSRSSQQKQLELKGYGGTDLSFIDNRFKQAKYDGVVIFTDGEVPNPPESPKDKTILVLTENTEELFDGFKIVKVNQ